MFVGADTETHPFRRGWMSPRMVCLTLAAPAVDEGELGDLVDWVESKVGPGHVRQEYVKADIPDDDDDNPLIDSGLDVGSQMAWLLDRPASRAIWPALLKGGHDLAFHNAAFDLRVMMQTCPHTTRDIQEHIESGLVWDTVHREKLLANAIGQLKTRIDPFTRKATQENVYKLFTLVARYFGVDLRDEKTDPERWQTRYNQLDGVPVDRWPQAAVDYAVMDAVWPLYLLAMQDDEHPQIITTHGRGYDIGDDWRDTNLPGNHHPTRCHIDTRRSPTLPLGKNGIERFAGEWHLSRGNIAHSSSAGWGLRTDEQRVDRTIGAWTVLATKGQQIGEEAGFIRVKGRDKGKPGSRNLAALRALIAAAYELPPKLDLDNPDDRAIYDPELYSPKGAIKYSKDVLKNSGDEMLADYETCVSATGWMTKYAAMLLNAARAPLTYGVDPLKATGRISLFDPPYHQPPRKGGFRECHTARPGFVYLICDYDTAELRGLAQIMHDWGLGNRLRQMFLDGIDPHGVMGVNILVAEQHGSPYDAAWDYALFMACLEGHHGPEWQLLAEFYRHLAKAANFGLPGGLGARTFMMYARSLGVRDIDLKRATLVREVWRAIPENVAYLGEINRRLGEHDRMVIRQSYSGRVRGGCTYTSGANGFFQGLVADGFNYTAWLLFREMYSDHGTALFGCRTVLPLHDEFVVEAPEHRAHEAALRLREVMIEGMSEHIPDVPIEATPAMARFWYKGAKPVYDADDRLIPWTPPPEAQEAA